ncbi:MAG TPA: hypothetical protein VLT51_16855, partial [Anaerolineales bacterium]|nr:hypothetical protein [Anaerolineales bacterium]
KAVISNLKRLKRTRMTVTAGPSFTLPPLPKENRDEALKQYTDEIMCHIAALLPEKYRGVYEEHPRLKELLEQEKRLTNVQNHSPNTRTMEKTL